jgi:pimeloyl-ACP methyl ester carboxylesterase
MLRAAVACGALLSHLTSTASGAPIRPPLLPEPAVVQVQARPNVDTQAQIYLLRGLANVFSRGMDEMAARLQGYGFAPHILNHRGWESAADTIVRNFRNGRTAPIILIGHSLGANNACRLAQRLNGKGIPVAYLAIFDPTRACTVPTNVRFFVNFYQNNGQGRRASFPPSRHEEKVNLNLTGSPGLTHTNMDQSERLQNIVVGRVLEVTAR